MAKNGNGALFTAKKENWKDPDKAPDMSGSITLNGKDYWFSGWWRESEKAGKYLSVAIGNERDEQRTF